MKPRIPEGTAIDDSPEISMEQYSEIMKKQLGKEYVRFAENVIKRLNPARNSSVLEIGPGPGWAGIELIKKRNDLKLTGFEASFDMIRVAESNAKQEELNCNYIQGFGENMEMIPDKSFDLVISRDSLHHWEEPLKVFKEIERILKPDGKIYIHDSRRDMNFLGRLIVNIFSRFIPYNMGYFWKTSIASSYTPVELKGMLHTIGLADWNINSDLMDLVIYKN